MAIELATQFLPYVDEQFKAESKRQVITNNDFEFTGAHRQGIQSYNKRYE